MGEKRSTKQICMIVCASLTLQFSLSILVNSRVFPLFNAYLPHAKDFSTLVGALFLFAIAAIAMRRPFPFVTLKMTLTFAGAAAAGVAITVAGAAVESVPLTLVGTTLLSLGGRTIVPLYICFTLVRLTRAQTYLVLLIALVAQYPVAYAVNLLPGFAVYIYIAVAPIAAVLLSWQGGASKMLSGRDSRRLRDMAVANPHSFIPLSHIVFLTIAVFNLATGCALTYLSDGGVPQSAAFSILPLAILLVAAIAGRQLNGDALVRLSYLLILGGFLVVPLADLPGNAAEILSVSSPWLFAAGSSCFDLVFYLLLSEIGRRNCFGAVPLFALGYGASRIGFEAGALLGHVMNISAEGAVVIAAALAFLFATFEVSILNNINFQALIEDVRPVPEVQAPKSEPMERELSELCDRAVERFHLTPRETEITRLLAQGRSVAVIQEELVVSKNTVKTHVKNIYLKLDVHSQQELIDLIRNLH